MDECIFFFLVSCCYEYGLICWLFCPSFMQKLIFNKPEPGVRKIVLATNLAETSITINDVVFVVDCGKAKETSYDALNNTPCLLPTWISKASARQVIFSYFISILLTILFLPLLILIKYWCGDRYANRAIAMAIRLEISFPNSFLSHNLPPFVLLTKWM